MFELGIGSGIAIFEILGAGLVFVIIWILKSEKRREIYAVEMEELRRRLESRERERFMLLDKLEESEGIARESGESEQGAGFQDLESENERLAGELAEARESLEEVYKAVYEKE